NEQVDALEALLESIRTMDWHQTDETLTGLVLMQNMADRTSPNYDRYLDAITRCFHALRDRRYEIARR
ncbi:hypothetical protein ACQUZK_09410, partial [Streptococcus pyogenes]|uniref:hypothetical protein n=1 Tax=Streptococcus pyogenes TaxID=1314 RepID=UPI003DA0064B